MKIVPCRQVCAQSEFPIHHSFFMWQQTVLPPIFLLVCMATLPVWQWKPKGDSNIFYVPCQYTELPMQQSSILNGKKKNWVQLCTQIMRLC